MTLSLQELNKRTGFAYKRDYIHAIWENTNPKALQTPANINRIRDAYIIQGNFNMNHCEIFDEFNWRCEEMDVDGDSVVDDTTLFDGVTTLNEFQDFIFNTASNAESEYALGVLLEPIYKQAIDYAAIEGAHYSTDELREYTNNDVQEAKDAYSNTFDLIDPTKLQISQEIQALFPEYVVSVNDSQKLVDYDNNNVIIINTEEFESNDDAVAGIPKQLLLEHMNNTTNSIAIVTKIVQTTPDVQIELNLPPEKVRLAIDSNHTHMYDCLDNISETKYSVNDNNQLSYALSDLSEQGGQAL